MTVQQKTISTLYFEESGSPTGKPLLLIHGWGSSTQLMQPIASSIPEGFRVFNIDLPGHGKTPPPPVAMDVPDFARLIFDFILGHNLSPVTIIGHSNGGRIALYMASDAVMSSHVKCLVLISPSGVEPKRRPIYYVKKYTAHVLRAPFLLLPERQRGRALEWLRHTIFWRMLGSSDYRKLRGVMRETFVKTVNFYVTDRLPSLRIPTLIFWGDRDQDISQYQMELMRDRIPDAGLVVLKNAGHYGHLDRPDVFGSTLTHFLQNS